MASPRELFNNIQKGKFKPAYYFFGPEEYRLIEAQKFIVKLFLPDKQSLTNYKKIDGKRTPEANLIAELSNYPMLGERQLFAVSNIQSYKPKQLERIFKMLTPPDPNRIIIFSSPASKVPKKSSAFYKNIIKSADPIEFKKMSDGEVMSLVRVKLEKENISIDQEALTMLAGLLAGNRGALEGELTKLINYKGSGTNLTFDDIKKVSSGYEVFNMFSLSDQIVSGNAKKVLKMIGSLIADGTGPTVLTSLLQQHFISLYLVKNGKAPVGNRAFLIPNFKRQAQKYQNNQLEKIIIGIARLDSELRLSLMKPEMAFEILALNLTAGNI